MDQKRKFVFRADGDELVLPVTPSGFSTSAGKRIETVNIVDTGDVHISGKPTLSTVTIEGFFPANPYSFALNRVSPYTLTAQFETWAKAQTVVRFLVTGTALNLPVIVESIDYGEDDGSNDVKYKLILREYRYLKAPTLQATDSTRAVEEHTTVQEAYTVAKGDTLSAIARKFYGDSSLAYKLATANGIKNPNLIKVGMTLTIPDEGTLSAMEATPARKAGSAQNENTYIFRESTGEEERVYKSNTLHEGRQHDEPSAVDKARVLHESRWW